MRLVVFDMDGTLIDSEAYITQSMAEAFATEGLPPPSIEDGRQVSGLSLYESMGQLSGLEGERLKVLMERFRDIYHATSTDRKHTEPLYDGAQAIIEALGQRQDTLLGIATGKGMRGVLRMIEMHDFGDLFVTRQTPDHNPSKPHPGMLHRAMSETGVSPSETVMIGDTSFDMEMATAAGTKAIGVTWGYHAPNELREAGAHAIIDSYDELLDTIDNLLGTEHA